jgi:transposase
MGTGKQFKRGREASAALGVVPKQYSSGGKDRLYGITKRGDAYVRSQVIHGARSVAMQASKKEDSLSCWITKLIERRGFNKAVVALANKLIRIAWAVVSKGERYRSQVILPAA